MLAIMTRRSSIRTRAASRYRRPRHGSVLPISVLAGAAVIGLLIGLAPSFNGSAAQASFTPYGEPLQGCRAVDGDTLRCGPERIRLLAIDAPELPGHCRTGRNCAPGDPYASTASLAAALTGPLTIERVGEDRYGRTLALVAGAGRDLSCWQLAGGHAIYKAAWDNGHRVARTCPKVVADL